MVFIKVSNSNFVLVSVFITMCLVWLNRTLFFSCSLKTGNTSKSYQPVRSRGDETVRSDGALKSKGVTQEGHLIQHHSQSIYSLAE